MNPFLKFLSQRKPEIDSLIFNYIQWVKDNDNIPSPLKTGIIYAAEGGGKRLRPALALLGWEVCQNFFDSEKKNYHAFAPIVFQRLALAVELIHTYSLVHDDLPAMDNDSLRRGRPTCHVQFDEATAILIGDSLLNHAYELLFLNPLSFNKTKTEEIEIINGYLKAVSSLTVAAGPEGMIGGQFLDMEAEKKIVDIDTLKHIHENKTGKLIQASLNLLPVFYGEESLISSLNNFAKTIGLLYQVMDDILDVVATPEQMGKSGTDTVNQKSTFVKFLGLDEAKKYAIDLNKKSKLSLKKLNLNSKHIPSPVMDSLMGLPDFILNRNS